MCQTKDEAVRIETDAIEKFHIDFAKLCEDSWVKWIFVWTRHETKVLTAGFVATNLPDLSNGEVKWIISAYEKTEDIIKSIAFRALIKEDNWKCWCGCKTNIRV